MKNRLSGRAAATRLNAVNDLRKVPNYILVQTKKKKQSIFISTLYARDHDLITIATSSFRLFYTPYSSSMSKARFQD